MSATYSDQRFEISIKAKRIIHATSLRVRDAKVPSADANPGGDEYRPLELAQRQWRMLGRVGERTVGNRHTNAEASRPPPKQGFKERKIR
jgi:hypothetical protein